MIKDLDLGITTISEESLEDSSLLVNRETEWLKMFENPSEIPYNIKLRLVIGILYKSIGPIIQLISPNLGFLLGFIYLKELNNSTISTSLGLYISLMNLVCTVLNSSVGEKLGTECSKAVGQNNYMQIQKTLVYSLLTALLCFIFLMMIPSLLIEYLLVFIGGAREVYQITSEMLKLSIPLMVVLLMIEIVKGYCYSHNLGSWFGYISLMNVIFSIPLMSYLIFGLNLGIYGFLANRLIFESLNLLIYLIVALIYLPSNSKGIKMGVAIFNFKEFIQYFFSNLLFSMTIYVEFLCFEIQILYVMMKLTTKDLLVITASNNFIEIMYFGVLGFSNIFRTKLNNLIGMENPKAAKNFTYWFLKISTCLFIIIGVILLFLKKYLISMYSNDQEFQSIMNLYITIYLVFFFIDGLNLIGMVIMRSIGHVDFSFWMNFCIGIPFCIIIDYILIYKLEYGIWSVLSGFLFYTCINMTAGMIRMSLKDWNDIKLEG